MASEMMLQGQCFQWFWNTYPNLRRTLFHVQQKAMNAIEGSRFKAIGVVKGVSDMILVLPKKVVFIEFKTTEGKQSAEQIDFEHKVTLLQHEYFICRSFVEFKEFVLSKLKHYGI